MKNNALVVLTALYFSNPSQASIIINEIDYDQPGTDTAEFIELYNSDSVSYSLDGYYIDLINGNDGQSYRTIDLSGFTLGAGDYFVACNDTTQVANCDYSFTSSTSWFQNGAPDAIALFNGSTLLDSLSYEGTMAGFTEGSTLSFADNSIDIMSISRIPNGIDTNDNAADFSSGCITPGSSNIIGSGDCSSISAVPLPPSLWLLGSGAVGLLGVAQRKKR